MAGFLLICLICAGRELICNIVGSSERSSGSGADSPQVKVPVAYQLNAPHGGGWIGSSGQLHSQGQ